MRVKRACCLSLSARIVSSHTNSKQKINDEIWRTCVLFWLIGARLGAAFRCRVKSNLDSTQESWGKLQSRYPIPIIPMRSHPAQVLSYHTCIIRIVATRKPTYRNGYLSRYPLPCTRSRSDPRQLLWPLPRAGSSPPRLGAFFFTRRFVWRVREPIAIRWIRHPLLGPTAAILRVAKHRLRPLLGPK